MRILNCYAGIGGNRKLWGNEHEITAIEYSPEIAKVYSDLYPNDTVIVTDAHQYLLENYESFDFIWCSPPCPTHSITNHFLNAQGIKRYPDMALYQEIIFLKTFFKGKYIIENVKSYYEPLIKPQVSGRHYFWSNFKIPFIKNESSIGRFGPVKKMNGGRTEGLNHYKLGFDLSQYDNIDKHKVLNNCVAPEIGLAILESALKIYNHNKEVTIGLFEQ